MQTVKEVLLVDPSATIMVWIPQLSCQEAEALDQNLLLTVSSHSWLHASLKVSKDGLQGSTVLVVNPPVSLHTILQSTLSWLAETLTQDCNEYSVTSRSTN